MTARRWARTLEEAVSEGASPTGYGAPLTPLPPKVAAELLEPVALLLGRFREFVAEQAPAELAAAETPRSSRHTELWARNLLERLSDTLEEAAADAARGEAATEVSARAEQLARDARALMAQARRVLEECGD